TRPLFHLFLLQTILLLFVLQVKAQSRTATLQGTVSSTKGEVLPGTTVLVEESGGGLATDASGKFKINGLQPGTYNILISGVGYIKASKSVTLVAGQQYVLDIELQE